MEDLFHSDENHWVNVQDPVKQMIMGIAKSVKVQATSLREVDKRTEKFMTKESIEELVQQTFSKCFSMQNASLLVQSVNQKAEQDDVSGIEANLDQLSSQIGKLSDTLNAQNSSIRELNSKVSMLSQELEDLRNPNFDQIFSYIDRQVNTVRSDLKEKLQAKADLKDMEKAAYKTVDSVYKNLSGQINSLQKEMGKAATKEDFHHLLSNKADGSDIRDMAADLKKCVSKQEMQHNIASQVRPLVTAVTSLEKVIQIQEDRSHRPPAPHPEPPSANKHTWTHEKITNLIDDVLVQRYPHLGECVSSQTLDSSVSEAREYLLREMSAHVESLRLEIGSTSREAAGGLRKHVEGRIQELAESMREARNAGVAAKEGLKDLSSNVTKSLAKKADRSDLKRLQKEMVEKEQKDRAKDPSASFAGSQGDSLLSNMFAPSRSMHNISMTDAMDPENSNMVTAKRLRVVSSDVDVLKKDVQRLSSMHSENCRDIADLKHDLENEVKHLREKCLADKKAALESSISDHERGQKSSHGGVSYTDWRIALGELSLNLRREMSDKPGREEMINVIASELEPIDKRLNQAIKDVSTKSSIEDVSALDNALTDLRTKIAGELTGGRWLWTNGKIGRDGWIPWDTEVQNAAPAMLSWIKGSTSISARMPGLYRICGAVFTSLPSALQICLNGEPILSLQPNVSDPDTASNSQILREERYVIRRLRHSVGEVTCLAIDEYVSLPSDAVLSMRFHSAATAQAFFSIKKM